MLTPPLPKKYLVFIIPIIILSLLYISPCSAQVAEKECVGFICNLTKEINKAKTDFKNLKRDVKRDVNSSKKEKARTGGKKAQVANGFKDAWKQAKPKPVFTEEQLTAYGKYVENEKRLVSKTKATKKPIKEGIYIIDTKKGTSGYSKEFESVRKTLNRGKFDQLDAFYEEYYRSFIEKYGEGQAHHLVRGDKDLLRIYERASMYLYSGDFDRAINAFTLSEELAFPKGVSGQMLSGLVSSLTGFAEALSGIEELSPYRGAGWENILGLNYKTIAYLLKGERSAYNVTRRAIDIQNKEREIFKRTIKKAKKDNNKLSKKIKKSKKSNIQAFGLVLDDLVSQAYKKPNIKGQDVLSAYVNPLGFYIAGIVQEYDAFDDPSLTTNALISYKKAAELNPKSKVIKNTIKDIEKNGVNTSRQTIHVILANGYAPEKQVIETRFIVGSDIVMIKFPVQEERHPVARTIEVYNGNTKLATLETIADIEAIALRQQADLEPRNQFRVRFAAWRALGGTKLLSLVSKINKHTNAASIQVKQELEARKTPDMRAWLSLPEEILGARLRVSKKMNYLTLVTKNRKGKVIAKKTVELNHDGANFIFARSMGNNLVVLNNKEHWIKW